MSQVVNTYPLSNYSFGTKEPKLEKDTSVADRLARMKIKYDSFSFLLVVLLEKITIIKNKNKNKIKN